MEEKSFPSATDQPDLFTEGEFREYTEATTSQRFINFLVDAMLMQFALTWVTTYLLLTFLTAVSPETANSLFYGDSKLLESYLIGLINHLIYYTICEKAFRGHTLGKAITGTRTIREDGEELMLKDAFLRSLCRLVPFEALSIWFGNGPWHDTWTKTKVIQKK